jgi:hypothetical protein
VLEADAGQLLADLQPGIEGNTRFFVLDEFGTPHKADATDIAN